MDNEYKKVAHLGRLYTQMTAGRMNEAPSRDEILEYAETLYTRVRANLLKGDSPEDTDNVMSAMARHIGTMSDDSQMGLAAIMSTPEGSIQLVSAYFWAYEGYPQVTLGHKYAAALLTTMVPKDLLSMVKLPWRCMLINLPDNLIYIDNPTTGGPEALQRVFVMTNPHQTKGNAWSYWALTGTGLSVWRYGISTVELFASEENISSMNDDDPLIFQSTELDNRANHLLGTLIVNLCLAMTNAEYVKEVGPGHKHWGQARKKGGRPPEPVVRTFQVGLPVNHDFREVVRDYMMGQGHKLTVQSRVCGHYRAQVHGPKRSQRKIIWVQPYWRGLEDAPIQIHEHKFKEPK